VQQLADTVKVTPADGIDVSESERAGLCVHESTP
jgi:hypothetical protein